MITKASHLEAIGQPTHARSVAVGVRKHHHLVPCRHQALRQLVDVALHAARVGIEEIRHHEDPQLLLERWVLGAGLMAGGRHPAAATGSVRCSAFAACRHRKPRLQLQRPLALPIVLIVTVLP